MNENKEPNIFPEFHLFNRNDVLEAITNLAHFACDQMHHVPERARGAEAMLSEKLMTEDISGATHSELYKVWMDERQLSFTDERGTDW